MTTQPCLFLRHNQHRIPHLHQNITTAHRTNLPPHSDLHLSFTVSSPLSTHLLQHMPHHLRCSSHPSPHCYSSISSTSIRLLHLLLNQHLRASTLFLSPSPQPIPLSFTLYLTTAPFFSGSRNTPTKLLQQPSFSSLLCIPPSLHPSTSILTSLSVFALQFHQSAFRSIHRLVSSFFLLSSSPDLLICSLLPLASLSTTPTHFTILRHQFSRRTPPHSLSVSPKLQSPSSTNLHPLLFSIPHRCPFFSSVSALHLQQSSSHPIRNIYPTAHSHLLHHFRLSPSLFHLATSSSTPPFPFTSGQQPPNNSAPISHLPSARFSSSSSQISCHSTFSSSSIYHFQPSPHHCSIPFNPPLSATARTSPTTHLRLPSSLSHHFPTNSNHSLLPLSFHRCSPPTSTASPSSTPFLHLPYSRFFHSPFPCFPFCFFCFIIFFVFVLFLFIHLFNFSFDFHFNFPN